MNKLHHKLNVAVCAAHLAAASGLLANNIQVTNVTLQSINTGAHTALVQFDVSWENSWRVTTGPANYDAAWVFVKYHTGDLLWKTATLDVSDAVHSVPSAATLDVGANGVRGMGAFIYRAGAGSGNSVFNGIRLRWDYGADGVADTALVTLDVHAIEMVFVPSGAYQVGDGVPRNSANVDIGTLCAGDDVVASPPFAIVNAGPTPCGPVAGSLAVTGLPAGAYKPVPVTFPNGFGAYYVMKYEASHEQWAAFVNATSKLAPLTYTYFEVLGPLAGSNPPIDFLTGRQVFTSPDLPPPSIVPGPIPPNAVPAVPTRPVVQAKFPYRAFAGSEITTLAYLDWSGLRPFTEFELEKAARGPVTPVPGEYAWGTADIALVSYGAAGAGSTALSNDGFANEGPGANYNESAGNAWHRATVLKLPGGGPILGPARVGMFAKPAYNGATPPRIQSGAGYYGAMDLTGSVSEVVAKWNFPLAASQTAVFTGEHGDGVLGANGQHNQAGWALVPAGATFFGLRGGSFADAAPPISQRSLIAAGTLTNPGIRGVRSAPSEN